MTDLHILGFLSIRNPGFPTVFARVPRGAEHLFGFSSKQKLPFALKNLRYQTRSGLFKTFWFTAWFHMCFSIVWTFSVLIYDVENKKIKKEKPLNEKECPNLWPVPYCLFSPLPWTWKGGLIKWKFQRIKLDVRRRNLPLMNQRQKMEIIKLSRGLSEAQ